MSLPEFVYGKISKYQVAFPTLEKEVVPTPWLTLIEILEFEASVSSPIDVPSTGLSIELSVSPIIKYLAGAWDPVAASVHVKVIFSWVADADSPVGWFVGSGSAEPPDAVPETTISSSLWYSDPAPLFMVTFISRVFPDNDDWLTVTLPKSSFKLPFVLAEVQLPPSTL